MIRSILLKFLARVLYAQVKATSSRREIDGINIYFKNIDFFDFYDNVLSILKKENMLSYIRVKNNVNSIIEIEGNTSFCGYYTRTFYDGNGMVKRNRAGYRRVAANLLKFSIETKLLFDFHQNQITLPHSKKYKRLLTIAVKKELDCCKVLKCEDRQIETIENWILQKGERGSRKVSGSRKESG